jgi:hypothetical protein
MKILSPLAALGAPVSFELAPQDNCAIIERSDYSSMAKNLIKRKFKADIQVSTYVERLKNVLLYYISTDKGRGDELYYFSIGGRWFHGEPEWSKYHQFLSILPSIIPSAVVSRSCFFIGTRNNYTHQLVDFFPSIFIADHPCNQQDNPQYVLGSPNNIVSQLFAKYYSCKLGTYPHDRVLWLSDLGEELSCGNWKVRCILFKDIGLVRHMSIFEAFRSMREWLHQSRETTTEQGSAHPFARVGYLKRNDGRVRNQYDIEDFLASEFNADCIEGIHERTFQDKYATLSRYSHLVIPPGSDSINAACFSNDKCQLIQLSGTRIDNMFANPFYSFASLRYFLPFLDRMSLVEPVVNDGLHSGIWSIDKIRSQLQGIITNF